MLKSLSPFFEERESGGWLELLSKEKKDGGNMLTGVRQVQAQELAWEVGRPTRRVTAVEWRDELQHDERVNW
jgi:hypothetical protein